MARRIVLHIGVMKSATSYLQALCEENREQLAGMGIYWCPEDLRYQGVRALLDRPGRAGEPNSSDRVLEAIGEHSGVALLSNELLAGLGRPQVRRLLSALPDAEVHVVITARDLARIIPSHWQTTVKNGRTWTWAEFAAAVCADGATVRPDPPGEEPDGGFGGATAGATEINRWFWKRHDLPAIVSRWAAAVPLERITLVTVPAAPGDLATVAERFGSVVGFDVAGLAPPGQSQNPTLGAHSVELLRRLNSSMAETELDDPEHRFERALGAALAASTSLEPRFGLTESQQTWVRARAQRMVEALRLTGVRVVGDFSDLLAMSSSTPTTVDPGDTSESELLAAAARGLVGLAPVFNGLRAERSDLERRLAAEQQERSAPSLGSRFDLGQPRGGTMGTR
jgi:hypothetical protein